MCETVGPDALAVVRPIGVYLLDFFRTCLVLVSPYVGFISFLYLDLYVLDNSWPNYGSFMQTKNLCVLIHEIRLSPPVNVFLLTVPRR